MAIIKCLSAKSKVGHVLRYVKDKEKTDEKIISGINCNPETAKEEMTFTKELYEKTGGRQYYHVIQSFKPGEVAPEKAHDIGKEFAEAKFENYECLVCTHVDKEHIHNHIIINSVNKETGKMYHSTKHTLIDLKQENNRICEREHLSIPEERKNRYFTMKEIKTAEKGISLKFKLMNDIDMAKENSSNREEFTKNMEKYGYSVNWTDTRKYITYTMPEGNKFRDRGLPAEYSKEAMENGFRGIEEKKCKSRESERVNGKERGTRRNEEDFKLFFGDERSYDYSKSKSNDSNGKLHYDEEPDGKLQRTGRVRQEGIAGSNKELRRDFEGSQDRERINDKQSDKSLRRRTRKAKECTEGDRREFSRSTDGDQERIGKDKGTSKAKHKGGIDAHGKSSNSLPDWDNSPDNIVESMAYSKEQGRSKDRDSDNEYSNDHAAAKAKQINQEIINTVEKDLPVVEKKEKVKDKELERSISRVWEPER
jgi:hypothetical protein